MPTRKIKFSKYFCPFNELVQNYEADQDTNRYGVVNLEEDGFEELPNIKKGPPLGPAVICDFGILPINERTLTSKQFNLWMINTNFTITSDVADTLEETDGVESLDIVTRYKARFSVGECFSTEEVKKDITMRLCEDKKPKVSSLAYNNLARFLSSKYEFWAIVTCGATLQPINGSSKEDIQEKISKIGNKIDKFIYSWESHNF